MLSKCFNVILSLLGIKLYFSAQYKRHRKQIKKAVQQNLYCLACFLLHVSNVKTILTIVFGTLLLSVAISQVSSVPVGTEAMQNVSIIWVTVCSCLGDLPVPVKEQDLQANGCPPRCLFFSPADPPVNAIGQPAVLTDWYEKGKHTLFQINFLDFAPKAYIISNYWIIFLSYIHEHACEVFVNKIFIYFTDTIRLMNQWSLLV